MAVDYEFIVELELELYTKLKLRLKPNLKKPMPPRRKIRPASRGPKMSRCRIYVLANNRHLPASNCCPESHCSTKGEEMIMKNHKGISVTPTLAVRRHCVECVGSTYDVNTCGGRRLLATNRPCPLFQYRHGERRISLKVIRQGRLACCGSSSSIVAQCPSVKGTGVFGE